jgi:hypothetical protein
MSDWATLFRNFIYRDVAFILGGSIVLASATYCFDLWDPNTLREFPISYVILFAALAYVVGYAVQDFLGIFRISTTATPYEPRCFMRGVFCCFTRRNWTDVSYGDSPESKSIWTGGTFHRAPCRPLTALYHSRLLACALVRAY